MNIYTARYENALRIANKINEIIDSGCIVFDENNDIVSRFFIDDETGDILQKTEEHCSLSWFINDTNLDNGYHTTVHEYKELFANWKYVNPKDIHPLKV